MLWPSELNPCQNPEAKHYKSALYCVKGRVTKLCVYCVVEKAKAAKCDVYAILDTFNPDPEGAPTT